MFNVEVWGEHALFTRPEMSVERVSYNVMTPSAARGILESIYWHPGMRWVIDEIDVLNPITYVNIRRNEVSSKILASNILSLMNRQKAKDYIATDEDRQQRASMVLKDVRYVISAHFEITDNLAPEDNIGKFTDIIKRRLEKGQAYMQPYFGCREFPAYFRKWEGDMKTPYDGTTVDFGLMLYDMDYQDKNDIRPMLFHAIMVNGRIDLRNCEVLK